jgi:4-hydroxy-2-oxoheptanedioate aldolase
MIISNALKEKLGKRPVFGMTVYSGSIAIIQSLGFWGFDFAFIDGEHTAMGIDQNMEKLVMAAQLSGISPLVRVSRVDEVEIRKALEMGADGVIIPHVRTKEEAETCVRGAKFPPKGRRGVDGSVKAARYGARGFNWEHYIQESNDNTMVLPMAEDFEFMDNIDAIMDVPGIDAINFGPADFASSKCLKTFYKLNEPTIQDALKEVLKKAKRRNIHVMAPVIPPNAERLKEAIDMGVDMLIMGNDMLNQNTACANIMDNVVSKYL